MNSAGRSGFLDQSDSLSRLDSLPPHDQTCIASVLTDPVTPALTHLHTTSDSPSSPFADLSQCLATPVSQSQPPSSPLLWTPPERSRRISLRNSRPLVPEPRPLPFFLHPIDSILRPSIPKPLAATSPHSLRLPAAEPEYASPLASVADRPAPDTAGESPSPANSTPAPSAAGGGQNTSVFDLCWAP